MSLLAAALHPAIVPLPLPPEDMAARELGTSRSLSTVIEAPRLPADHDAQTLRRWAPLVDRYFPNIETDNALCVIWFESRGDPAADNPNSSAWGLWQFIRSTWDWVATYTGSPTYAAGGPLDPEWSTINARWLWDHYGYTPWNGWDHCQ